MSNEGTIRQFQKLKGRENFDTWKISAKSYLVIRKVWKCFNTELAEDATSAQKEENELAWSELSLLLDESILSYIADTTTAKGAWDALENAFEDSSLNRKVELLKQLVHLKLSDCESTEVYVNKMQMTSMKVKKAGLKIDDELVASFMLAGLPDEFLPLVMAVENSKEKLTIDGVKTLLLQDTRLCPTGDNVNNGEAFFAKSRNKSNNFKFRCHKCGIIGHMAKHCTQNESNGEQRYNSNQSGYGYHRPNEWNCTRQADADDAL